ncbi:calcineurin-like phosphoesterase family protein [Georgenia soli]|uniref:Calcineurin-like phosphoesterase family protein n=1 Tax=Georgenia soli TaxID=638953 RepID=A0A2A9ES48_9MICO|nr:phosphodiester glycosidase family protein [Georgenia soli]PFG41090.1 calcineurin-like phosphoesterase family protein [Georgenia soli]
MHLPARRLTAALAGAGLCLATVGALPALATTDSAEIAGAEALADLVTVGDDGGFDLGADGSVLHEVSTTAVAPGLDLTSFQRLEEKGWTSGNILRADLTEPTLSMRVLDSGTTTAPATVLDQVKGSGAVAAVNGNHFDMNFTNAPIFTTVSDGEIINGYSQPYPAFTLTDGVAAVEYLSASGTLTAGDVTHELAGLNRATVPANSIGVYNERWGSASLDRPAGLPGETDVATAVVSGGVVTAVADTAGEPVFPDGGQILLGRGAGARALRALEVAQAVEITVEPSSDVDLGIGGNVPLVLDGALADFPDEPVAARTVLGLTEDGSELIVATVDGRSATARGLTRVEMAELMIDLGAHNAVNIDGGGSTTMVARPAGGTDVELVNVPSDGSQRVVANSLAFFSSADTAKLTDVAVRPVLDGEDAHHVLPGLRRTVEGVGLSEQLAGTDARGRFTVTSPGSLPNGKDANAVVAEQTRTGAVLEGVTPGPATVTFKASGLTGATNLTVLGPLDHVTASTQQIAMEGEGDTATIRLTGHDADGFSAPIEIADVEASVPGGFTIEPAGLDAFTVTATTASGSAVVQLAVAGTVVQVPVTVGLTTKPVTDLADGASWRFEQARASGALTVAQGPDGQPALRLTHDFTTSTATRGSYAVAPAPIPVPGQPQAITMLIDGDATGAWPRLQVRDGDGVVKQLDGPMITWEGWKETTFTVPAGTPFPLTLERVRIMETRSTASYRGDITFTDIRAVVAPDVEQPVAVPVHDPVIVTDGTVDGFAQRIAVMSDAQFVGRAPGSDTVAAARRTLQEIVAEDPDLLVINGDLVDEGAPVDFDLARRVLDEEVGDAVPYLYVPGNHEIMGGSIEEFEAAFGPAQNVVDVDGTRVITLDTSAGSLRAGGLDQIRLLEDSLAEVASDPTLTGVVVFFHHPTEDPLPADASQISDRHEAAALDALLGDFRARSGKSVAAVNAHVGAFHARSFEGVSNVVNGNSGKSPASTPDKGGFTGWTLLGVDPAEGVVGANPVPVTDRLQWLRAEVHARVDSLVLDVPAELALGETAVVTGTVTQDGGRQVPVAWPMSADWSGEGVTIAPASGTELEGGASVLRLNPATGELTAVGSGTATVRLTVNGVTEEVTVTVPEAEVPECETPGHAPTTPPGGSGGNAKALERGLGRPPWGCGA